MEDLSDKGVGIKEGKAEQVNEVMAMAMARVRADELSKSAQKTQNSNPSPQI